MSTVRGQTRSSGPGSSSRGALWLAGAAAAILLAGCDGQEPPVAGDDAGVAVDQDRVRPAELEQAGGDLGDMFGAVCSRVPLVGAEPVDVPMFQFSGQSDRGARNR